MDSTITDLSINSCAVAICEIFQVAAYMFSATCFKRLVPPLTSPQFVHLLMARARVAPAAVGVAFNHSSHAVPVTSMAKVKVSSASKSFESANAFVAQSHLTI